MRLLPLLDSMTLFVSKGLSLSPPPTIETLGFPPFGDRIRDRHRRWWKEGQYHPLKDLGGKRQGQVYMQSLGYQVPAVYAQLNRITDLPPLSSLPPRLLIKPDRGHSVRDVFAVINGKSLLDDTPLTHADIIARVGKGSKEPFIVEELLQNYDNRPGLPYDYKFNCFGGHVASINVIERNSVTRTSKNRYWYLSVDWALMPFRVNTSYYHERTLPPKPDYLDEMFALVRDVGRRLNCYVRIDLYATPRGPVFGEFTAFPSMGYGYSPQAEAYFGALWQGLEGCTEPATQAAD
jgi:hypothetical protein